MTSAFFVVAAASYPLSGDAADEPAFNTVHAGGRNYINIADFVRYYGFDRNWQQNDQDVTLRAKYRKFQFKLNGRESWINGVRVWLNDSPLEYRNSILISETDVRKTLDPVLRAWAAPRRKVRTVMIDPGHGGEDQGTQGYRGTLEKRVTLDMAARVEKFIRRSGFETLMTRRTDTYVSLEDRSQLANASEADVFVSLHFNSAKPNPLPKGVETYCLTPVGLASTGSIRRQLGMGGFDEEPGNQFDRQNMVLAYVVQQKILKALPEAEDRGVRRARFFVIKATERPSILIEGGFLSNPSEEKRILNPSYRDKLAAAIAEGVKRYAALMDPPVKKSP
ncbi:MAG: N-acetylmuramoyl-L-alanine amidase [Verrucomicrobia bacterium]|nr:N-acetylmuramoyl-L-alanine amidase [Verrucomicrobiota bacterium]